MDQQNALQESELRLIVDTDGGVDDMVALLVADLVADTAPTITTVGGNVSAQQAAQNAAQMMGRSAHTGLNPPDWVPEGRHGVDGLHGAWDGVVRASPVDAVDVLVDALADPAARIACIGPLTNLAAALRRVVESGGTVRARVVALGGVEGGPESLGDTNRRLDAGAAARVSTVVEWISLPAAAAASRTPVELAVGSRYWSMLAPFARRTMAVWSWDEEFPLYDAAVVCAAMGMSSLTGEVIADALD